MSPANNFKKAETIVLEKIIKFFKMTGTMIINFTKMVIHKGKQRFTVMFIPHSEKKIINFHISIFSLVFICTLLAVLIIGFFGLSTYLAGSKQQIKQISQDLEKSKTSVEKFEDEIKNLSRSGASLKKRVNELLSVMNENVTNPFSYSGEGGDLSSWNISKERDSSSPQLSEIKELRKYIDNVIEPIDKIEEFFKRQKTLLVDIPNLWPVAGGMGNITAYFGPEEHPFTHSFRLHNAVDIAWTRGSPLVATADGVIEDTNYNALGLGNNITIRHKYGFITRYGHLDRIIVVRGQRVTRNSIIGYMGSTGLSTGPHVHYEVWIGDQVVDPMSYFDMNDEIADKIK